MNFHQVRICKTDIVQNLRILGRTGLRGTLFIEEFQFSAFQLDPNPPFPAQRSEDSLLPHPLTFQCHGVHAASTESLMNSGLLDSGRFRMTKYRSLLNPLTRLKKQVDSCVRSFRLGRIPIEDFLENTPRYEDVVVSLTSIPSRLGIVHLTIRSVFTQTHLPRKIVLWLHEDLKGRIPRALASLVNEVFEIRYNELSCSHRKLVSSLECFPEDCIVTCDDDCMYESDWLENLYASHVLHPADVIGGKCRRISYNQGGELMPYKKWRYSHDRGGSEPCLMAVGFGGTLYPPHCMMKDVTDPKLFLELAPRADDLWFKAMALLNDVDVRTSLVPSPDPIQINRSQKDALRRLNTREDGNHRQWTNLCNHYKIEPERVTGATPRRR